MKAVLGTDWLDLIHFGQTPTGEREMMLFTMPRAQLPTFDLTKGDVLEVRD